MWKIAADKEHSADLQDKQFSYITHILFKKKMASNT